MAERPAKLTSLFSGHKSTSATSEAFVGGPMTDNAPQDQAQNPEVNGAGSDKPGPTAVDPSTGAGVFQLGKFKMRRNNVGATPGRPTDTVAPLLLVRRKSPKHLPSPNDRAARTPNDVSKLDEVDVAVTTNTAAAIELQLPPVNSDSNLYRTPPPLLDDIPNPHLSVQSQNYHATEVQQSPTVYSGVQESQAASPIYATVTTLTQDTDMHQEPASTSVQQQTNSHIHENSHVQIDHAAQTERLQQQTRYLQEMAQARFEREASRRIAERQFLDAQARSLSLRRAEEEAEKEKQEEAASKRKALAEAAAKERENAMLRNKRSWDSQKLAMPWELPQMT